MNSQREESNRQAKSAALAAMERLSIEATGMVEYQSRGRVVVIGDNQALEIAPRLHERLHTLLILTEGVEEPGVPLVPLGGRSLRIEGYLGDFKIHIGEAGKPNAETVAADLVLDLTPAPLIDSQLKPPGYFHTSTEEPALQAAIDALSELTGSFEKPRYFDYDPGICAHGRSGKQACNRCIEACPADAITGLAETIEVNAHLCQGGGVCATVCPSGAIRYTYPGAKDSLARLRKLLGVYREAGGSDPVVVFLADGEREQIDPLPANALPFPLEELASAGLEVWLSALAYGARTVLLADAGGMPASSQRAVREQIQVCGEILAALDYPAESLQLIDAGTLPAQSAPVMPEIRPAGFSGIGGKRDTAFLAIDHLREQSVRSKPIATLPAGAPFGRADVDPQRCTLCFSCVGACPGKALQTGGEGMPQLQFIEENCLQCGMCTRTCPEDAIWITPRLLFDPQARREKRKLHEEEPFLCTACGKPFATRSVIDNMMEKLKGHYMFQNERARRRLTLCEDCRVIDIVQDEEAMNLGVDKRMQQ
ncbi:MAG: 4Fe-4S binding protein [Candidatus Thiodiazotropha sp.]